MTRNRPPRQILSWSAAAFGRTSLYGPDSGRSRDASERHASKPDTPLQRRQHPSQRDRTAPLSPGPPRFRRRPRAGATTRHQRAATASQTPANYLLGLLATTARPPRRHQLLASRHARRPPYQFPSPAFSRRTAPWQMGRNEGRQQGEGAKRVEL